MNKLHFRVLMALCVLAIAINVITGILLVVLLFAIHR